MNRGPLAPLSLVLLVALVAGPPATAQDDDGKDTGSSFLSAFRDGEVHLGLRYRFETVDQDSFDDTAEASTLRTTLSFRTGEWHGWSLFLEAEDVTAIFDDDGYNNAGAGALDNRVRGVPVIADPEITDVNQVYVRWRGERGQVTLGRQEINLGDQRFVGAVGWRQNHQSFDAARLELDVSPSFRLDYTYADAALRIFGDHLGMQSHFLYAPWTPAAGHRLTAYGVWLDYELVTALSTSTFGLEYAGEIALTDAFTLRLELEAAQQDEVGENPVSVDTDYRLASVGGDVGRFGFDVTWEVLGESGDGARAFQTPLATLHKWNGWADKFLLTPGAGLETLYLRAKLALGERWRLAVIYHDFTSDRGSFDYGTELDAELVYTAPWRQSFALKLAAYDADLFSTDTEKVMVYTHYTF